MNEFNSAFPVSGTPNKGLTKLEYISTEIAKAIISQKYLDTKEHNDRVKIAFQSTAIASEILKRTSE